VSLQVLGICSMNDGIFDYSKSKMATSSTISVDSGMSAKTHPLFPASGLGNPMVLEVHFKDAEHSEWRTFIQCKILSYSYYQSVSKHMWQSKLNSMTLPRFKSVYFRKCDLYPMKAIWSGILCENFCSTNRVPVQAEPDSIPGVDL
jgi:hypothetical protein